jgi:hypothetical protein
MPQADPPERLVDGRETGLHPAVPLQLGLELGQREVGRRFDQPAQVGFVGPEHPRPVPAVGRRRGAPGRPQPLHQLDRGRWADRKASRGLADRAAALDRMHNPLPQVHGHRCRHDDFSAASTEYCRITGSDSTQ